MNNTPVPGLCFTMKHKLGIVGALVSPIEVFSSVNPSKSFKGNAIWDTGAVGTLITPKVASELGLLAVSQTLISTPSSTNVPANIYWVNLLLPNKVMLQKVPVIEGIPQGCDVLVGMDIISKGDFAVTAGQGKTVFSFRMPSMTEIDFCKDSHISTMGTYVAPATPGRNDLCPCGSGKKYKKCCGR